MPSTMSVRLIGPVDSMDNMDVVDLYRLTLYFLSIAQSTALTSSLRN